MRLQINQLPQPWYVKKSTLDGADVTNRSFELRHGVGHRLDIGLSDRVARLFGTVTDRSARPLSNVVVIAFPEDLVQ